MAAPSPSTESAESPSRQLRNSCDACNIAKIKCSKARPQCRRCESRELPCVYSISLRSAKGRASKESRNASAMGSSTQCSNTSSNSRRSSIGNASTGNPLMSLLSRTAFTGSHFPSSAHGLSAALQWQQPISAFDDVFDTSMLEYSGSDLVDANGIASLGGETNEDDSMGFLMHVLGEQDGGHQHFEDCLQPGIHDHDFQLPLQKSDYGSTATFGLFSSDLQPKKHQMSCCCQQSILSKLSELSISERGTPAPLDKALLANKTILAVCSSAIECPNHHPRGGSSDVTFALTLVSLFTHAINVFSVLFHSRRNRSSSALSADSYNDLGTAGGSVSSGSISEGMSSKASGRPSASRQSSTGSGGLLPAQQSRDAAVARAGWATMPVRLMLGSYELDTQAEEALQLNLFKMELAKIKRLIDALERRFASPITGGGGGGGGVSADGGRMMADDEIDMDEGHGGIRGGGKWCLEAQVVASTMVYLKKRLRSSYDALALAFETRT